MHFRVLGPLEVWAENEWQPIGARKWRSLLATLLVNSGQIVSVDALIDAVWGDDPPAKAANLISIYVLRLRRLIGDPEVVVTRAPGYLLRLAPGDLDSQRFEELVAEGRRELDAGDPGRAAAVLREALGLWRGDALADVPPSSAIEVEAERLAEFRLAATELRIEADLACGRFAQVVPELRSILVGSQLRERLWLLLMRALDGDGRRAEALEAYAQAREAIADQLGVDPGAELRRLHQELLAADRDQTAPRQRTAAPGQRPAAQPGRTDAGRQRDTAGPSTRSGQQARPRSGVSSAPSPGVSAETPSRPQPPRRPAPQVEVAAAWRAGHDSREADDEWGSEAAGLDEPLPPVGSVAGGSVPASVAPARDVWPPVPRPAQLPADIGDFTGRADVVAHLCWLLSSRDAMESPGAVPVAVVAGSGGLGKTSLAVHAAHRLTQEYPDGQLYVDLLGATPHPQAPSDVLARFLRDLGVESAQVPAGEEERAALYRTRLAGRRVLVLLDNARDAAQVRPLLPGSSTCGVLVTARSRMPDLAPSKLVDLEVLDDDESLTLFARIVGEKRAAAEPEATAEVLVACAGLPLAIRICAARLAARSRWSIGTLAERLRDQRRRLDELRAGDLAVRASFQVSLNGLPASVARVSPARLFGLLGLWPGPFIGLDAAAVLFGDSPERVEEALETLVDACLLESPAPGRYRFHDLLRVYAADLAQDPEIQQQRDAALRRVLEWYLYTAAAAADQISPHRTRVPLDEVPSGCQPLNFANLNDALEWCETERPNIVAATRQAAADGQDEIAWRLPAETMPFFNRHGYRSDWIATHEVALGSARKIGDSHAEAAILTSLGMAYAYLDLEEAVKVLNAAVDAARAAEDLPRETHAAVNLAYVYLGAELFDKVIEMHEGVIANLRRLGNRYGEGIILTNVGEAHLGLGQAEEAIAYLRQSREICSQIGETRGESYALRALGDAYRELDKPEEAISWLEQAVAIARSAGERVAEAAALTRLGTTYRDLGEEPRARESMQQAQDILVAIGDAAGAAKVASELKKYRLCI